MPLSINTNIASMTAQRSFMGSNAALETAFERLSTGKRINSAVDDAAGLAIGKDLEARVSGLNQAIRNTNDGISIIQIAEGALDEGNTILQRLRDLSVQAANDSLSATERGYLKTEADALIEAFDDITTAAKWGGSSVFDTSYTIQTGSDNGDTVAVAVGKGGPGAFLDTTAGNNGAGTVANAKTDITLSSQSDAATAIANVDLAMASLATTRTGLGALQAQLESTVRNLANVAENTAAAAGRIMDTDYAAETANLTKAQILQQAATSILAQANAQPQSVLALLQ